LKPIITIYSTGTSEEAKKFEGYISAAFWIGVDHVEGDVSSVKVRQPVESYDNEVASLTEFTELMVQRQISFSVEFFAEPSQQRVTQVVPEPEPAEEPMPAISAAGNEMDYEAELTKIKNQYKKGVVTKRQYEAKKEELLRSWREKVEGRLGR
jgi:hypothetical protein